MYHVIATSPIQFQLRILGACHSPFTLFTPHLFPVCLSTVSYQIKAENVKKIILKKEEHVNPSADDHFGYSVLQTHSTVLRSDPQPCVWCGLSITLGARLEVCEWADFLRRRKEECLSPAEQGAQLACSVLFVLIELHSTQLIPLCPPTTSLLSPSAPY